MGRKSIPILLKYRKTDLILIMTPEKQDRTLELSKHWSAESTPERNEVIMKRTYPVKSVSATKSAVIINKCMLLLGIGPAANTTRCSGLIKHCLPHA